MISNNRISQATSAFFFARSYGLSAATQTQPAEEKVRFDNNLFDGNVFSNQALPDSYTSYSVAFAYVFQNMGYAGDMSAIPGERMPGPGDFLIENNVFKNNVLEPTLGGAAVFGSPVVPGIVIDDGGNRCPPDALAPLNCLP